MSPLCPPRAASQSFQATASSQVAPKVSCKTRTGAAKLPRGPQGRRRGGRGGSPGWLSSTTPGHLGPSDAPPCCIAATRGRGPGRGARGPVRLCAHLGQSLLLLGAQVSDSAAHPGSDRGAVAEPRLAGWPPSPCPQPLARPRGLAAKLRLLKAPAGRSARGGEWRCAPRAPGSRAGGLTPCAPLACTLRPARAKWASSSPKSPTHLPCAPGAAWARVPKFALQLKLAS